MIDIEQKLNLDTHLQQVLSVITDCDVFLVGGYIRDLFFNKISNDKDLIVVGKSPRDVALEISEKLNGHFIELDTINNIYRVVLEDKTNYVDIVTPQKNLDEDLARRDFTINAICYDVKNKKLIDRFNGVEHILQKKIVEIKEQNFLEDPIRVLRAFRFQALLGFEISENLFELLKKYSSGIFACATERISTELIKLFGGKYANQALCNLDKLNLCEKIFPIMGEVKKIPPNTHHHLPLFEHLLQTMQEVQNIYENSSPEIKYHLEENFLGEHSRLAFLKLSAFLHDIGKPATWVIEEDTERHRFIKHDEIGAKLAQPLLKELSFSNKQSLYIQKMIANHIYPSALVCSAETTDNARRRFLRKMENDTIDIIILAQADRLSARGIMVTDEIVNNNISGLNKLLDFYFEQKDKLKPLPKLLDGNEIMQILNIKQSPKLGKIIKTLHEEQLNETILTKEDAIKFVLENFC